jgi:hypothetical protein
MMNEEWRCGWKRFGRWRYSGVSGLSGEDDMRTIDRCIFGAIAIGIWTLAGAILLGPRSAASQSSAVSSLMAIATEQITKLDCKFDGNVSAAGAVAGDMRCHL